MCSNDKAAKITNVFNFERVKKNISKYKWTEHQFVLSLCCWLLLAFCPVAAQAQAIPDGKYIARYADGVVKERGFYLNGQKHKTWQFYHANGAIDYKEKWVAGQLKWQIFYNNNGRIIKTIDEKGVVKTRKGCGC
jgi:antitoxin component YwqK of YwqJK toxin-antitoxin module